MVNHIEIKWRLSDLLFWSYQLQYLQLFNFIDKGVNSVPAVKVLRGHCNSGRMNRTPYVPTMTVLLGDKDGERMNITPSWEVAHVNYNRRLFHLIPPMQ